jgi:hypothetical protein
VTVTFNADNTASMMVEYMGDQPAMMQNGTWAMAETDDMVNFMYGTEDAMMTMPLMVVEDDLQLSAEDAMGFGGTQIVLERQAMAAEDPHAGHNH